MHFYNGYFKRYLNSIFKKDFKYFSLKSFNNNGSKYESLYYMYFDGYSRSNGTDLVSHFRTSKNSTTSEIFQNGEIQIYTSAKRVLISLKNNFSNPLLLSFF